MSLVNYSSSSSLEETDEEEPPLLKRTKVQETRFQQEMQQSTKTKLLLPKALNKLGAVENEFSINGGWDDPTKHEGRVRSFKHERGNWASYIYIPVNSNIVEDIQEAISQSALKDSVLLKPSENLHISLSKTIVLQYHLIESFTKSLENALHAFNSFTVCLRQLKIYTNEERTRTFVALKVDELYFEKMRKLMKAADNVMQEYRLEKFYPDPSFHTSILWCVGDHMHTLNAELKKLENIVQDISERTGEEFIVDISEINFKTGNKHFKFKLR